MNCRQCGMFSNTLDDGLCDSCRNLKEHPDDLSKRTRIGNVPFQDLKQQDEVDRIETIVNHLVKNPGRDIVVMVDTGRGYEGKGDRYINAILEKVPNARVVKRGYGPVKNTESIIFRL